MASITLIRPPSVFAKYAITLNATPPISVAYIAGGLCHAGHAVRVVDAVGVAFDQVYESHVRPLLVNGLKVDEILARIPYGTEYVGISCLFTHEWPNVQLLAREIKRAFPSVRLIIGGEHATAVPEYSLTSCPEVDAAVLGEGEETVVDLIEAFERGRNLASVAGIAYRSDGGVTRALARGRIRKIDDIPLPRWDLIGLEPYLAKGMSFGVNLGRTIPMLATRGCPFQCTFCSSPFMWTTRYETRNPRLVVEEIESYIRDYKVENIDFYDLTAVIKREWIIEFCCLLMDRGLGITWQLPSGTRTEAIDREVADLLRRSGCTNLSYAPESGSPRVLKRIKKKVIPERMIRSMKDAVAADLNVKANIIFGFPDETFGDVMRTYKFIMRMALAGVHDMSIWVYSPYPGCEMFDLLKKRGKIRNFDNEYFISLLAYSDFTSTVSYDDYLSPRVLKYLRLGGMLLFYLTSYVSSPRRLAATIRHLVTGRYVSRMEMAVGALLKRLTHRRMSFGKRGEKTPAAGSGPKALERIDFKDYYSGCGGSPLVRWLDLAKVRLLRRVIDHLPRDPAPRILDLGCGTGSVLSQALNGRPAVAVGLDIHPALLQQARQRSLRGVQGNFDKVLAFRSDTFDVVVMVDTLEHVTSREKAVAEVKRVLKPDGHFVVFTPPYDSPVWNIGERVLWAVKGRAGSGHISPFTRESLTWLLARHFRSHEIRKLNFNLTMYGLGCRKLDAIGGSHGHG